MGKDGRTGSPSRIVVVRTHVIVSVTITVFVVVVGRSRLGSVVSNRAIAMVLVIIGVCEAFVLMRIVRHLPQLGSPPGLPHRLQNLLLVRVSGDCHFLQVHVYVNIIHS